MFKSGLRKAASDLAGQPLSQFSDVSLANLSAVGTLLFLLEDSAANLVCLDLQQVDAARGALTIQPFQVFA
jgi:hypothetical protein